MLALSFIADRSCSAPSPMQNLKKAEDLSRHQIQKRIFSFVPSGLVFYESP